MKKYASKAVKQVHVNATIQETINFWKANEAHHNKTGDHFTRSEARSWFNNIGYYGKLPIESNAFKYLKDDETGYVTVKDICNFSDKVERFAILE